MSSSPDFPTLPIPFPIEFCYRHAWISGSYLAMIDDNLEDVRRQLAELKTEHRDLDDVISRVSEELPFDQLRLQRLKKRKLSLKDEISRLENALIPDIIA
jgi:hypothetical protein